LVEITFPLYEAIKENKFIFVIFFLTANNDQRPLVFSVRQSGRSPPALSGPEPALRTWRDECQLSRFLMAFEKVERTKKYVRHFFYFFLVVVVFFSSGCLFKSIQPVVLTAKVVNFQFFSPPSV
jgi:hypothetical protein